MTDGGQWITLSDGRKVRIEPRPRARTWGGTYQHHVVTDEGGRELGRLQTVRRGGREERTTHTQTAEGRGVAVLGHDLEWMGRMDAERAGKKSASKGDGDGLTIIGLYRTGVELPTEGNILTAHGWKRQPRNDKGRWQAYEHAEFNGHRIDVAGALWDHYEGTRRIASSGEYGTGQLNRWLDHFHTEKGKK